MIFEIHVCFLASQDIKTNHSSYAIQNAWV